MNPFEERKKQQQKIDSAMKNIKYLIAVGSGKGGVGKSTVSANLALSLAKQGYRVGLADADVYGPSIPTLFNIEGQDVMAVQKDGEELMVPFEKYGLKLMSIGFLVDKKAPLMWRGPMASNALIQMLSQTDWGELDYLILDMPPGTGDIQLTLVQSFRPAGALFVCTPQQLAVSDVRRAVNMFENENLKVPVLGLVENMSYFTPTEFPDKKYYIFGKEGGKELARELNIDFLGEIPISENVSTCNDNGNPVAMSFDSVEAKAFMALADRVVEKSKNI
ncbi:MAG: Mrp/NBP35 family ATP-binding protein [Bacteroidales bacterium]|nr:Mrp/NBP35 family ATP-binding protein [Bacteroidales bacterium]MBQ7984897.1 Mrp/NBP35 family ATP-binding protein [Bacteroidales bacterium]